MKLTNRSIYALLLVSYIGRRTGRVRLFDASEELNIDLNFLEQIARQLRVAGILKCTKGPGGGCELAVANPLTGDVLAAVGVVALVNPTTYNQLSTGSPEALTVLKLISTMQLGLNVGLSVSFNQAQEIEVESITEAYENSAVDTL